MSDNSVFHIFNKSIAGFNIFHGQNDFDRFYLMMQYFLLPNRALSFSNFLREYAEIAKQKIKTLRCESSPSPLKLVAYCLMPTHFHLVLYQQTHIDISNFMHDLQSSYTQFFNIKHKRKGPLWEGRFKHVECETDEQLLHLTRYVHLNPVTAYLVEKPEDWTASSYIEYIGPELDRVCDASFLPKINPSSYAKFVCNRINEQRMLAAIKRHLLD